MDKHHLGMAEHFKSIENRLKLVQTGEKTEVGDKHDAVINLGIM